MNKGCLQTIALLFPGPVTLKYHLVFHHLCLYLQLVPLWDEIAQDKILLLQYISFQPRNFSSLLSVPWSNRHNPPQPTKPASSLQGRVKNHHHICKT